MKKNKIFTSVSTIISDYLNQSNKNTAKYYNIINQPGITNPKYIPDIPAQMITNATNIK